MQWLSWFIYQGLGPAFCAYSLLFPYLLLYELTVSISCKRYQAKYVIKFLLRQFRQLIFDHPLKQ